MNSLQRRLITLASLTLLLFLPTVLTTPTPLTPRSPPTIFHRLTTRGASSPSAPPPSDSNALQISFSDYIRQQQVKSWAGRSAGSGGAGLDVKLAAEGEGEGEEEQVVHGDAVAHGGVETLELAEEELFTIITEVNGIHLALSLIPAFIVIFALFSAFIKERLYAGEAVIAVVIGIILGPYVAGVFDPRGWGGGTHFDEITLEFTQIVIALSVFAVGVELPRAYMWRHWRSLAMLLGPLMLVGWLVSGAFIYILIPSLPFLESLVVAAAVTPTDPILAASVVGKGKFAQEHVPAHLRHLLQAESGSNDGAAFPFLFLALFMLLRAHHSIGETIGYWILLVILYQIVLGVVIGAVIGIGARKLLKFCKRHSTIDRESMVAMYVALALLTTGLTTLCGSDDLLAAFACGTAFAWDNWFTESIEESNFSNIIDLLINCTTFIYLGATIPFSAWNDPTLTLTPWRMVLLGLSILALRRLPAMLLLGRLIPDIKTPREAIFCGHFGPIGVGAVFISTLAVTKLPVPTMPPETSLDTLALVCQPVVYLFVLASVLVHGLSIPFFSLGRNVHLRVHSMTRTWTQASASGEPNWLSRVKRVDRNTPGGGIVVGPPEQEKEGVVDSSATASRNGLDDEKYDEKVPVATEGAGDGGFPDTTARQRAVEAMVAGDIDITEDSSDSSSPTPPEMVQTAAPNESVPAPPRRPTAFRLPTIKRVGEKTRVGAAASGLTEEEEKRRLEKLKRDEWCRRERRDGGVRGEERVFKTGKHIIVENIDGDVLEVRDLDPDPARIAAASSSSTPANIGVASVSPRALAAETAAVQREGGVAGTTRQKLEAARRLLERGLSWTAADTSGSLPAPGRGPRRKRAHVDRIEEDGEGLEGEEAKVVAGEGVSEEWKKAPSESGSRYKEKHYCEQRDETRWVEGHRLIIERNDGEDVEVRSLDDEELAMVRQHGPGAELRRALSPALDKLHKVISPGSDSEEGKGKERETPSPQVPVTPASEPLAAASTSRSSSSELAAEAQGPSPSSRKMSLEPSAANVDEEESWTEEEDDENGSSSASTDSPKRPRSPRQTRHRPGSKQRTRPHVARASSAIESRDGSRSNSPKPQASGERGRVPPRTGSSSGLLRISAHPSAANSRSSSPTRSIRFVDGARPNRARAAKKDFRKKKSLLGFTMNKEGDEEGESEDEETMA